MISNDVFAKEYNAKNIEDRINIIMYEKQDEKEIFGDLSSEKIWELIFQMGRHREK